MFYSKPANILHTSTSLPGFSNYYSLFSSPPPPKIPICFLYATALDFGHSRKHSSLHIDCVTEINIVAGDGSTVQRNGGEGISLVGIWGQSLPGRGDSRCHGPEVEECPCLWGHRGADSVGSGDHCKGFGVCSEGGGKTLERQAWADMTASCLSSIPSALVLE